MIETCWTIGNDNGHWSLVACWTDPRRSPELYQLWTRDEPAECSLGTLDSVLQGLLFAAINRDDGESAVEFEDELTVAIENLVGEAIAIRAAARIERKADLEAVERRIEDGDESPDLLGQWETASAAVQELGFVAWERLIGDDDRS